MDDEKSKAEQAEINIGMVGHVDHGKTSLTLTLTGKWTDTHSEELKRGISIRLGYADTVFYKCPECSGSQAYTTKEKCPNCGKKATKLRSVSFVDAPGHETLMTTMLSGAALMKGAVLVIAANEQCPQPQTAEHLMTLNISGIKNIVVAQNKIDLVDKAEAIKNHKQIKEFLEKNGLKDVPIIPISANFGTNIDLLIEAIEKSIPTPSYDCKAALKMYCARSFDINRPGTKPDKLNGGVLGGSIVQGTIKIGDKIGISPGINGKSLLAMVKSLSTEAGLLDTARPGGLIAIGTLLDPSITHNDTMRGQVIATPGTLPEPVTSVKLETHFLERLVTDVKREIKKNENIVLTVGTMAVLGTVTSSSRDSIEANLKSPIIAETGEKVTLSKKEASRWRLVAYGIIK